MSDENSCKLCGVQLKRDLVKMETKCPNKNCPSNTRIRLCTSCGCALSEADIKDILLCHNKNCVQYGLNIYKNTFSQPIEAMPRHSELEEIRSYFEKGLCLTDIMMGKVQRIKSGNLFILDGRVCSVEFRSDMTAALNPNMRELIIKK